MPKSKTRKPRTAPDRPARPPVTAENALEVATLALYQASCELVREAEVRITAAARAGDDTGPAIEVHHHLRTAALGILVSYSQMTGLPDPRSALDPSFK